MAGGGLEIPLYHSNWTWKFDYLYADLGTQSFAPGVLGGVAIATRNVKVTDNIIRIGLNYRFNWGGPIVAKY